MRRDDDGKALRRFIRESQAPESFTHLAAELRARFGLDISPEAAADLWRSIRMPRPGRLARYERNEALMRFIADRADLVSLDKLLAKVAQAFGSHQTPSRSQLFRLVQQVREAARGSFQRETRGRS